MPDLSGRTVLVTGASGGLGPSVVDAFLAAGARVVGASRSGDLARDSPAYRSISVDLTSPEGAAAAVEATVEHGGAIDVVAQVMGGFAMDGSIAETDVAIWDKMMTLNLRSAFLVFRAALGPMRERGFGRIVAVSARAAFDPPAGLAAYAVSKAGLQALIKAAAAEGRDSGVTANAVVTSTIDTPANRRGMPDADFSKWVAPESLARQIVALADPEAGDVNGALVPVYGRV